MNNLFYKILINTFTFLQFILRKTKFISVALFIYFLFFMIRKLIFIENKYILIILIIYLPILFSQIKWYIIKSDSAKAYWESKLEIEKLKNNDEDLGFYELWEEPTVIDEGIIISIVGLIFLFLMYLTVSANDEVMIMQSKGLIFMLIFGFGWINIIR